MIMTSPNDNISLKDGGNSTYKMRAKDISSAQDGSLQSVRHLASAYPIDYGIGGCYRLTSKSASMAAGLAASSPIYSFRWTSSTLLGIIRRVRLSMWSLGTGFTAGIGTFDMFVARSWSAADTGGTTDTTTGNNGKLRTAMAVTVMPEIRHSSTATLTAGTRTLDTQPIEELPVSISNALNTAFLVQQKIFEASQFDHPLVLAQNEGFVLQASVPATGVWGFAITPEWDEVPLVNY